MVACVLLCATRKRTTRNPVDYKKKKNFAREIERMKVSMVLIIAYVVMLSEVYTPGV